MKDSANEKQESNRTRKRIHQLLFGAFIGSLFGFVLGSSVTYAPSYVWNINVGPSLGCAFFAMLGASFVTASIFAFQEFDQNTSREE
jgi:hypothetical protein